MSVNEEDQAILSNFGQRAMWNTIAAICESGFWAIYLVLFAFAIRIQIKRGIRSSATIILLVVSILLFASSTALWAMFVSSLLAQFEGFFVKYSELDFDDRFTRIQIEKTKLWFPEEALFLFNMIVGDGVVIWRAWVLCSNTRLKKLVYIPIVMLSASFAFAIVTLNCLAEDGFGSQSTESDGSRTCQWGEPIAWGISLLTNVTATSLIAIRAWSHHRFLTKCLGQSRRRSQGEKMLLILVESGFIYCLFWMSQLILFFPVVLGTPAQRLYSILSGMGDQISGLYPTLIIILVNMQRSMSDDPDLQLSATTGPTSGQLSTLQFQTVLSSSEESGTSTSADEADKPIEQSQARTQTGSSPQVV
uniref:Uncharacterized protein n=1 Tax=Moniliophthora roreri TaxID=221103 RepID=A0A0W0EXZ4_MONRR